MSGEELYWAWVQAMSDQDVAVDAWGDLDYVDQTAWDAVADFVNIELERAAEGDRE